MDNRHPADPSRPVLPAALVLPKWAQWLLIIATVALLAVPIADAKLGFDPTPPPSENRVLAPLPTVRLSRASLQQLPAAFEKWERDHFGLRSSLIALHSNLFLDVLGVSPTSRVVLGQAGWLYFGTRKSLGAYRCVEPFSEAELKIRAAEIRQRRDWAKARGITYINAWAPIKDNIYPEYLPSWLHKGGPICRIDQYLEALHKAGLPALDLRPSQKLAKAAGLSYYPTDTHWNPRGGYFAYRALIDEIRKTHPEVQAIGPERIKWYQESRRGGDLAGMMDLFERYRAPDLFAKIRDSRCSRVEPTGHPVEKGHKQELYTCPPGTDGKQLPKLVLLHDSFGNAVIPFLAQTFGRTFALEFSGFDIPHIELEKPDIIVDFHLERQLEPD